MEKRPETHVERCQGAVITRSSGLKNTHMKINRRLAKGWSGPVENKHRDKCDIDGAKVWIGPGDQIYCDLVHDSKDFAAPLDKSRTVFETQVGRREASRG
jgi:hypothetical protein